MERKRRVKEAATGLVRWGKAHPELVEEEGRRVNVGQVKVKEGCRRTNQHNMEGQFCD